MKVVMLILQVIEVIALILVLVGLGASIAAQRKMRSTLRRIIQMPEGLERERALENFYSQF